MEGAPDPREFARAAASAHVGPKCLTCKLHPEAAEWAREVLAAWTAGEGKGSIATLHRALKEHFSYPKSYATFRNHLIQCEPDLWNKAQGNGGA